MIRIDVTTNAAVVAAALRGETEKSIRRAGVIAATRTAQAVKAAIRAEMPKAFDRPTPWTLDSLFVDPARFEQQTPEARVWVKEDAGGKGVPPTKYLLPEVEGGARGWKRSERAFQAIGLLQADQQMVPAAGAPRDAYGNIPRGFIVQMLSYFSAFNAAGYTANMSKRRRAKLADRQRTADGYLKIGGVEYFISRGRGMWYGRLQHLPAGIWSRKGIHGSDVTPVILFVRRASYRPRLDFADIARRVDREVFEKEFERALRT